jgi:hypothetical protein
VIVPGKAFSAAARGHGADKKGVRNGEHVKRDRGFESGFLQRRVRCEPDFLSRVDHAGEVLDVLVQRRRDDARAALRLMRNSSIPSQY